MVGEKDKLDIATELVHTGERGAPPEGKPTATPIYASTTYTYDSMEEVDKVFAGAKRATSIRVTAIRRLPRWKPRCVQLRAAPPHADIRPGWRPFMRLCSPVS